MPAIHIYYKPTVVMQQGLMQALYYVSPLVPERCLID